MSKVEYEVDGAVFATHDDKLDGRQLRDSGGRSPASDYVLVRIDEGFARSVGLEDTEKLPRDRKAVFRSFESDHVNTLHRQRARLGVGRRRDRGDRRPPHRPHPGGPRALPRL